MDTPNYSDWAEAIALIAFLVSFGVFAFTVIASACLPAPELKRLGNLPLENERPASHEQQPKR